MIFYDKLMKFFLFAILFSSSFLHLFSDFDFNLPFLKNFWRILVPNTILYLSK